jgi:ubiquinone/menaquinone biosynthesis C-methylase UbiE
MTGESIVFDRAAEYYDRTRALPADIQSAVTDLLADRLQGRGRVLELGVGTGRMALPLRQRGIDLVGLDLSEPMMRKLVENAGGTIPFPLVQADALALPLADGAVGAAYLCHVLHLIPRWEDVVAELVRVVGPGGVVLVDLGGAPTMVGREINQAFYRFAAVERARPGCTDPDALDRAFVRLRAVPRLLPSIPFAPEYTINDLLDRLAGNLFSSTWSLSDDVRNVAVAKTRAWAAEHFGDLDARRVESITIQWRAYELP